MAGELYRTYEVLIEESIHPGHSKRAKDRTSKQELFNKELDAALRDTHMMFQDGVCFYTLCIAGLAGNEKRAVGEELKLVNPLWHHLTTPEQNGGMRERTMQMIRRLSIHYEALKDITTPEQFLDKVFQWKNEDRSGLKPLLIAAYDWFDENGIEYADAQGGLHLPSKCKSMKNFRNDQFGRLFDTVSGKASTTRDKAVVNAFAQLKGRLATDVEVKSEKDLAEGIDLKPCFKTPREPVRGLDAIYDYLAAFNIPSPRKQPSGIGRMQPSRGESEADRRKFAEYYKQVEIIRAKLLEEFGDFPSMPAKGADKELRKQTSAKRKAWIENAKKKAADFKHESLGGNKPNKRLWFCLRFKYHPHPAMRLALYEEIKNLEVDEAGEAKPDAFEAWRTALKTANGGAPLAPIEPFSKLCLGGEAQDSEFDKSAFVVAAEDVFKYKVRTADRERKVEKLLSVIDAYEGTGEKPLDAEHSPTGKATTIRGMKDDPRWEGKLEERLGIKSLLEKIQADKELDSYGLREGTIGGWAEVRKMLLRRHKQANKPKRKAALNDWLQKGVDKEQTANRQGFGSADFFHALCDPDYHHLWLTGSDYEPNGIKDFVPHFVSYCEWREELIDLLVENGQPIEKGSEKSSEELKKLARKPISYTWPGLLNRHKKASYRYFDFAAELNASLKLPCLFRRIREKDGKVMGYKKLSGDETKVTLAARRLKRDKIMTADGSSIDALWCPPLILQGREAPTNDNSPRAGKYDDPKKEIWPTRDIEVSFSLVAAPLADDPWLLAGGLPPSAEPPPVHLTVSFKLETTAKLEQEGCHFVSGSLKGVDEEDDKRKFFRWPVDIETDRMAAAEADKKAKAHAEKDGKPPKKTSRKADAKPEELWCHGNEGFTVKESRYSKKEEVKKVGDLHVLAIDLGNRFAAGAVKLRLHRDPNVPGRIISAEGEQSVVKASLVGNGFTLRLQGEDAEVWQVVTEKNQKYVTRKLHSAGQKREAVVGTFEFVKEKYGNDGRGRFPDEKAGEFDKFKALAVRLVPEKALSLASRDKETLPELGDHLIFRLKRRLGRVRTLFNLLWRLCGDMERNNKTGKHDKGREQKDLWFHRRMALETLARSAFPKRERQKGELEDTDDSSLRLKLAPQEKWDEWNDTKQPPAKRKSLFVSKKGKEEAERVAKLEAIVKQMDNNVWCSLAEAVKQQITSYCEGPDALDKVLVEVVEFCLPLRGRHWGWDRSRTARLHWDRKDEGHKPKLEGMRGLSMRRLGQLLDLRQRCQSYAKLEDRHFGTAKLKGFKDGNYNPPDSSKDDVDDCCPLLLERSNRIREARIEQAAHLILAEALGMELKNPAQVENKFSTKDDEGKTVPGRKTLVDLHGEYQRRKIKVNGVEQDCPRCSVIVLENLERYKTSQERTKAENSRLMKWAHRAIIEKLEDMCKPFGITIMLVDPAFSSHFDSRTGLPGVRVNKVSRGFHERYPYSKWINDTTKSGTESQLAKDIKKLKKQFEDNPSFEGELLLAVEGGKEFLPVNGTIADLHNADITAAMNVGLRGVADPQRWDIFPRLRTKRAGEGKVSVTNWRGAFCRFDSSDERRVLQALAKPTANGEVAQQPTEAPKTETKKKGGKGKAAAGAVGEGGDDSKSAQSSEFPPFFVEHPEHDWVPRKYDWLKKAAFEFEMDGKKRKAYPQGVYLKCVERECGDRITDINEEEIKKW